MDSCQFLRRKVAVFVGLMGSCLCSNTCKAKPTRVSEIFSSITYISRVYSSRTNKTWLCRTSTPTFRTMRTLTLVTRLFTCPHQTITTVPNNNKTSNIKQPRSYRPYFQLTKSSARKEITMWLLLTTKKMPFTRTIFFTARWIKSNAKLLLRLLNIEELEMFVILLSVAPKWQTLTLVT